MVLATRLKLESKSFINYKYLKSMRIVKVNLQPICINRNYRSGIVTKIYYQEN